MRAADSAWTDVAEHLAGSTGLAILPFGALEQHGPQLPLATDTLTAERVAETLAERFDALLLPAVAYGETWNNAGYPGTLSLSPSTVVAIALDLGHALANSGARGFVVVNGDWGNRAPLAAAADRLNREGIIPALVLDYPGMDEAIDRVRESRGAFTGLNHAEEVETSIILAIAPHLVHPERYAPTYPDFPPDFGERPMQLHPFSPSGVFGDPTSATASKGHQILDATIEGSARLIVEFSAGLPPRRVGPAPA
jgi:creatinine amidohydrolase